MAAADKKEISIDFTDDKPPWELVEGYTSGNRAKIFMRETENGYVFDQLGIGVDGMERTSQIGLHEGLHALGVGGSKRAEALVRLEELRAMDVPIDRKAMRQVLSDMGNSYDGKPWLSGGEASDYFPGLKF